jgi:hypothetical protein
MSPLAAILRGLIAGAPGTLAMDTLLFARYVRGGGESDFWSWESSADLSTWKDAPAPAQVGKRLFEGLFQRQLPPERARLVNNLMHWGYGTFQAGGYGIVAGSLRRPRIRYGFSFGAALWASDYVILGAAKLYKPIWEYDAKTLARDLSAHVVYGVVTACAFQLLSGSDLGGSSTRRRPVRWAPARARHAA